jgi:exonuclease SbcD
MKILHTADWHVGVTIRGRKRDEEQRAVLEEIASISVEQEVDLVIVAGDLFHNAAPTPEAEDIAYNALLKLAQNDRQLILISGNHDSSHRLDAIRPLLKLANVTACGRLRRPDDGGVVELVVRTGETVVAALLPFLSQRGIVTADHLMSGSTAENVQEYADRMRRIVGLFAGSFRDDAVNLIVAHLTVAAAKLGGGERQAHTIFGYHVPANIFPTDAHYVALGHLHREQKVSGPCPTYYSGSPILIDFGEEDNVPSVSMIEARAGSPATVDTQKLTSPRGMRTLRGNRDVLMKLKDSVGDDFLRIEIEEKPTPGLADEIRDTFPNAVDVRISEDEPVQTSNRLDLAKLAAPRDLFVEYLEDSEIQNAALVSLFDTLVEEALETDQT